MIKVYIDGKDTSMEELFYVMKMQLELKEAEEEKAKEDAFWELGEEDKESYIDYQDDDEYYCNYSDCETYQDCFKKDVIEDIIDIACDCEEEDELREELIEYFKEINLSLED